MTFPARRLFCLVLCFLFALTVFAQDPDEKPGRPDNPAARQAWFLKGRQTRNGKPPAMMLHKAQIAKMQMRAARLQKIREARATQKPLTSAATLDSTWVPLGPKPINDSTGYPTGYGSLAGRVTAMAVDQGDSTGNTVYAAGAYGGVWKSTNAAASDPTTVAWTPIMDDQPTLSVGAIALQPGNSNVILVGTGEPNFAGDSYYGVGILRSTDGGTSWSTISSVNFAGNSYSLYGSGVAQIAFSTKNPNFIVAAVSHFTLGLFTLNAIPTNGIAGLIYSTDAGASWTLAPWSDDGASLFSSSVSAVIYNPTEDKFYAAIPFHGFYASNATASAGFTYFKRMQNQPGATGVLSTTACPTDATSNGGACPILRGALTVRPVLKTGDPNKMYAWFVSDGNGDSKDDMGIWQSTTASNGTVTWTRITDTGITNCGDNYGCGTQQSFYNLYISAVPNGTSNTDLYAGTVNIYKCQISTSNTTCSTTPFQNLTHVYGCSTISEVHPDQHAIDFLVSNPNIVYFGNDGGVNRTLTSKTGLVTGTCPTGTTKANSFDNLNTNIGSLSQFTWGAQHPTDPTTLLGGTQDNGTMAVSGALPAPGDAGWWEVDNGDGGYTQIDPVTPSNWYTAYYGVSIQYCAGKSINCNAADFNYLVAEDASAGLHQVDGDTSNFYMPYILDPAKPTNLIVGTCRVWRGPNDTTKWTSNTITNVVSHKLLAGGDTSCTGSDDLIQALAAGGPSTTAGSKVIWATTTGGHVFVTTNATTGAATWKNVTGSIDPDGFPISGVALDPQDPTGLTAYVTVQGFTTSGVGHVWRTVDGGANWVDQSATLPNAPFNDVTVDPLDHKIYVGSDIGVFTALPDGGWSELMPSISGVAGYLPNVAVFHVAVFSNGTDRRLRAWTHGRGVWETTLSSPDMSISAVGLDFTSTLNTASSTQSVVFKNLGANPIGLSNLTITGAYANEFTVASSSTCGSSIAVGSSCKLDVSFTPTVSDSPVQAYLNINTTSATYGVVNIALNGTVNTPAATAFSYDFAGNPTTATVKAGVSATYNFSVVATPTGANFSPALAFTCSGLPNKSACSFSPASVSTAGAVVMTITTTASTSAAARGGLAGNRHSSEWLAAAFTIPGLMLLVPGIFTRSRRQRLLMYVGMMMIFAAILGMSACGGGGSSSSKPTPIPGTTPGTYTVHITGTGGTVTATQDVTLVVQ